MTIKNLIQLAVDKIDILDAELILAHILALPREYIIAHPEKKLGFWQKRKFKKMAKKRQAGLPLAYITNQKEFFGLDFFVNRYTLIPRPETEVMVEEVIKNIRDKKPEIRDKFLLIDVGTGSGCIPISIIKTLKHTNTQTFVVDISKKALRVAKKNAKKHNVEIKFLHGNLLQPISAYKHLNIQTFKHIFITANLPYLTEEQFKKEKSIQYELKSALVGGKDGLALYEKLLNQIQKLRITDYKGTLTPTLSRCKIGTGCRDGLRITCFLEIDPSQSEKIKTLIKQILPAANVEIQKDLCGRDRIVRIDS